MKERQEDSQLTCRVCGHPLEPYMRICDKCGSIQRPFKTLPRKIPKDKFASCERCGKKIPADKKLCDECNALTAGRENRKRGLLSVLIHWIKLAVSAVKRMLKRGK